MGTKAIQWPQFVSEKGGPDFASLYSQHVGVVRRILARMVSADDLDDLVQEVFIRVFRFKDEFREDSDWKTWIYRISVNTVQDHYRKEKWKRWLSFGDEGEADAPDPADMADVMQNRQIIERALRKLTLKERTVVVLFYLEDATIEEISTALDLPEGTIKSRLHAARTKLQGFLEKEKFRYER